MLLIVKFYDKNTKNIKHAVAFNENRRDLYIGISIKFDIYSKFTKIIVKLLIYLFG